VKKILLCTRLTADLNWGNGPSEKEIKEMVGSQNIREILDQMEKSLVFLEKNDLYYYSLSQKGLEAGFSGNELTDIMFRTLLESAFPKLREIVRKVPRVLFHLLCYHYRFPSHEHGLIHPLAEVKRHYSSIYSRLEDQQFFEFLFPHDIERDEYLIYDELLLNGLKDLGLIVPLELGVLEHILIRQFAPYRNQGKYYALNLDALEPFEALEKDFNMIDIEIILRTIKSFFPVLFKKEIGLADGHIDFLVESGKETIINTIIERLFSEGVAAPTIGNKRYKIKPDNSQKLLVYLRNLVRDDEFWYALLKGSVRPESPRGNFLVFVSYSTKDSELFRIPDMAKRLAYYEQIKDVLYWEEDAKEDIYQYMDENLRKCDIMLLFCSPNSDESEAVRNEWESAKKIGKPIIPVFMRKKYIPVLLNLRGVQYDPADFDKTIREIYERIMSRLVG